MLSRAIMCLAVAWVLPGAALAETASPDEVARAYHMFFPAAVGPGPVPLNADLSGGIAKGLDGDWYRADILGSVDPDVVRTACSRGQSRITTAPNEITVVQQSKLAPVTYRYTYVSGSRTRSGSTSPRSSRGWDSRRSPTKRSAGRWS